MQHNNGWLHQVIPIAEDTPYHSSLTGKVQLPAEEMLTVEGITIFQLNNGRLCFRFNVSGSVDTIYKAFAAETMTLSIPGCEFHYPVIVNGLSDNHSTLNGFVDVESFGQNDATLSEMKVHLIGLPQRWCGTDQWFHYEVMSAEQVQIQEYDTVVIPQGRLSARALSAFTLKADGWTARLREIPTSHRTNPNITHVSSLINESLPLTGAMAREFLDENLFPFLSFVFGQHIPFSHDRGIQRRNGLVGTHLTAARNAAQHPTR